MSFPSNERLFKLYEGVADQVNEEQIEALLRRAGLAPSTQEIKDVRHRIQALIQAYVVEQRSGPSRDER